MALGAKRSDMLGMVLRQGMVLVAAGLAVGMAAALLMSRMLATLLYQVRATDPFVLVSVASVLALVAAVACLVPALNAMRVE